MPASDPASDHDAQEDAEFRAALEDLLAQQGRRTLPPVGNRRARVGSAVGGLVGVVVLLMVLAHAGAPHNAQNYPLGAYPANVEATYLNACAEKGSVIGCTCALNFLQQRETASQMMVDVDYDGRTGIYPASFQGAIATCRGL